MEKIKFKKERCYRVQLVFTPEELKEKPISFWINAGGNYNGKLFKCYKQICHNLSNNRGPYDLYLKASGEHHNINFIMLLGHRNGVFELKVYNCFGWGQPAIFIDEYKNCNQYFSDDMIIKIKEYLKRESDIIQQLYFKHRNIK